MMGARHTIKWDEKNIGTLTKLWADGVPTAEIAAKLRVTSSAVIGKANRLGLPQHSAARVKGNGIVRQKLEPKTERRLPWMPLPESTELPPMPDGSGMPAAQRRTLLQLNSGACKWPFGEPASPDFFFCGGVAVEGKSYCAGHCAIAYRGFWHYAA
jgi:GcrA cell cycle regulator